MSVVKKFTIEKIDQENFRKINFRKEATVLNLKTLEKEKTEIEQEVARLNQKLAEINEILVEFSKLL